jgi:hypothetical protein
MVVLTRNELQFRTNLDVVAGRAHHLTVGRSAGEVTKARA